MWFKKSAAQGHAGAQCNLGLCYCKGEGVPQSYEEAVVWFKKSAAQGDARAEFNLGNCYWNGEVLSASEQASYAYLKSLGYEKKQVYSCNYEKAVECYFKSAEKGNAKAQNKLGYCYERGLGVAKNLKEAIKWYRRSAEQGNISAQNNLKRLKEDS